MSSSPTTWQPFRVQPRLDAKPWGGRRLARYGFPLPDHEPIGEALITAAESVVLDGPAAGTTLGSLVVAQQTAICGEHGIAVTGGRPLFPLLIKLIDAHQHLSLQVHPDNEAAARDGNRLGKTEAWHILDALPGAVLFLGLKPGVSAASFAAACRAGDGSAAALLRQIPAKPGMTVLTPAGTVHALGAGTLLYEIQQPSDITYRLDDWGRRDAAGNPRPLHLDQGLAVLRPEQRPEPIPPVVLPGHSQQRELLVTCPYFALERLELPAGASLTLANAASAEVITCLQGELQTAVTNQIRAGMSLVSPAAAAPCQVTAHSAAIALRAWVPAA